MIKVTSKTALPLKTFINRGSYEQRLKYAQELNAKFFEKIKSKIVDDSVSPKDYYARLKELIPEIDFKVDNYKRTGLFDNTKAQTIVEIDDYDYATNFILEIPYTKFTNKEKISLDKFYLAMHENFHLFASICNPKHVARQEFESIEENDIYNNFMYNNLYLKFQSKKKRAWKNAVEKNMENFSLPQKINFLQNCRYRLLEEKLAWDESKKYSTGNINPKYFFFEEKIKIIKKMLSKFIKEARNERKKNL